MRTSSSIAAREEAHEWAVQSDFLVSGYRKNFSSVGLTARSLFMRHNELMNIWTHFIAALFFLLLVVFVRLRVAGALSRRVRGELQALDPSFAQAWELFRERLHALALAGGPLVPAALQRLTGVAEGLAARDRMLAALERRLARADGDAWLRRLYVPELKTYPIEIFLLSAILCYLFSAFYHLFCDMEPRLSARLRNLDYAGISLLVSGSSFSILYYLGYCHPRIVAFYALFIFSISLAVFLVSLGRWIQEPRNSVAKALLYAALGLSNVLPMAHIIALYMREEGANGALFKLSVALMVASGAAYLGGLFIYTHRYPERYHPRRFDIWLNSHTLWHLCGVSAALMHFAALMAAYWMRLDTQC